ncbi:hypothetical protein DCCM_3058 [Desulfocucumis palustris]|uniref:Uncharacterized protein n=1 Tax=Desulfocucumis palustris TaxID=1898651 RepID=A0A2L2XC86_9FIRM|nr:hypothetical protein DCCM_3058 [Desulfocucumis palustris]
MRVKFFKTTLKTNCHHIIPIYDGNSTGGYLYNGIYNGVTGIYPNLCI